MGAGPDAPAGRPSLRIELGDRVRQRLGFLDPAKDRQNDQEVREVVERQDARCDDVAALGGLGAEPAQPDTDDHEDPEELAIERPVVRRAHLRGVEPRQEGKNSNRCEQCDHAEQLVRNGTKDRVERQIVPFRNDVVRRHRRVGRDVVVGVAEIVRHVEHEPAEHDAEAHHEERVLDRRIRREGHGVLVGLRLDAGRIVLPDTVQRPDVQHHHAGDHERQQIVQREEALQRRVADREAAPKPGDDRFADDRYRREEVGDDGGAPETHLAPRQRVAEEPGRHHQKIENDAEDPEHLAWLLVRAVVHAAEHVDVDRDKEHRCAVRVQVAQQPAVIHVAHDMLDGIERHVGVRRVVHHQNDAGDDLRAQQE